MAWLPWQRQALRDGRAPGPALALFAGLLVTGILCGTAGIVGSITWLLAEGRARQQLVEHGIVPPDAQVEGWHATDPTRSGRDGCLVADDTLVRWVERERVAAASLPGTTVRADRGVLVVEALGDAVRCPVGRGPDAEAFIALVTLRSRTPRPVVRQAEPTDPRLRRHLGLDVDSP